MSGTLYLAWRYLAFHRLKTGILVTSIALLLALVDVVFVLDWYEHDSSLTEQPVWKSFTDNHTVRCEWHAL